jgi:hypothetical protein
LRITAFDFWIMGSGFTLVEQLNPFCQTVIRREIVPVARCPLFLLLELLARLLTSRITATQTELLPIGVAELGDPQLIIIRPTDAELTAG